MELFKSIAFWGTHPKTKNQSTDNTRWNTFVRWMSSMDLTRITHYITPVPGSCVHDALTNPFVMYTKCLTWNQTNHQPDKPNIRNRPSTYIDEQHVDSWTDVLFVPTYIQMTWENLPVSSPVIVFTLSDHFLGETVDATHAIIHCFPCHQWVMAGRLGHLKNL